MREREDKSGGAGADPMNEEGDSVSAGDDSQNDYCESDREGGDFTNEGKKAGDNEVSWKDAKHTWEFCMGNRSIMLWNDMLRLNLGGEDLAVVTDVVITDGMLGSGSSVPVGTGTRSMMGGMSGSEEERRASDKARDKRRRKAGKCTEEAEKAAAEIRAYVATLRKGDSLKMAMADEAAGEDAADDVKRLSRKIKELDDDDDPMVKDMYEENLKVAKVRLRAALDARNKIRKK